MTDPGDDFRFRLYLGALSFGMAGIGYLLARTDAGVPAERALLELGGGGLILVAVIGTARYVGRRRERTDGERGE
jgi:hypothetical protein